VYIFLSSNLAWNWRLAWISGTDVEYGLASYHLYIHILDSNSRKERIESPSFLFFSFDLFLAFAS
jgi:hypothetical protein